MFLHRGECAQGRDEQRLRMHKDSASRYFLTFESWPVNA